jgi:hypothetical protein
MASDFPVPSVSYWSVTKLATVLALAVPALSGCHDAPRGQVVAVVGNVEITLAELNLEARLRGIDISSNRMLRDSLLAELVERKLLVHAASDRGVDQMANSVLLEHRARDILLAQQLLALDDSSKAPPSPAEIRDWLARHPGFSGANASSDVRVTDAVAEIRRARMAEAAKAIVSSERAATAVRYQIGYAPSANEASAGAK